MFCKMSSSGPSNVHLGGFPESCGGFVALRCCRVEQTLLNSGEQLWCEIGHVDALKATKEQQKVVTFKCSHRARFTWCKWAVSAGTKRGTLHFVINAANCVSTFPARGQLRAVSPCEQASEVHLSLSGGATVWWTAAGRLTDKQSCSVADSSRVRGGAERRGLHRIVKWTGVIFAGMFTCRLNLQLTG